MSAIADEIERLQREVDRLSTTHQAIKAEAFREAAAIAREEESARARLVAQHASARQIDSAVTCERERLTAAAIACAIEALATTPPATCNEDLQVGAVTLSPDVLADTLWPAILKANGSQPDAARTVMLTKATLVKALRLAQEPHHG